MLNSSNSQSNTSSNNITNESQAVTHFIILVPGTGPHREDERPKGSFLKKAKRFREIFQETCKREFADTDAYVEMMPIDYHADIQALETTNQRMIKATLPSIPWIRTMDNEVIGDILYYFSTFHGRIMLETVINKLNAAYDTFMTSNPAFSGSISLVAHSLGGLICYEILYYMNKLNSEEPGNFGAHEAQRYMGLPSLRFSPDRLFTLGSPMGGGMVFRNQCMAEYHMGAVGYHNIFHPFDPFGYRTEPLCDEYYANSPAVPITVSQMETQSMVGALLGRGTSDAQGSAATAGSAKNGRRISSLLGESMANFGKNVVDAVRWAAKSSVALPIHAVASKVTTAQRRSSVDQEKPRHRRLSLFGPIFSDTHAAPADASAGNKPAHGDSSLGALEDGDTEQHEDALEKQKGISRLLPGLKSFTFGRRHSHGSSHRRCSLPSNSAHMSSDDKKALAKPFFKERVRREIDSSDDNDSGGAGVSRSASSSSIVSISMRSHLAATMGAMAASTSAAESPSPPALQPSGERAIIGHTRARQSAVKPPSQMVTGDSAHTIIDAKKLSPQQTQEEKQNERLATGSAEPDTRRQSSRRNGSMTPDDMLDQLMQLFGPSRPPDRDQQIAESQGLPLSSRLMAARELGVTRAGAPIRVTNTVPIDINGMLVPAAAAVCPAHGVLDGKVESGHRLSTVGGDGSDGGNPVGVLAHRAISLPSALSHYLAGNQEAQQEHKGERNARANSSLPDSPLPSRRNTTDPSPAPALAAAPAHTQVSDQLTQQHSRPVISDPLLPSAADAAHDEDSEDGEDQHPLPYLERMDYIVTFNKRHLHNEYWLGFHAHFSYWTNKDIVYHILHHMIRNPASALSTQSSLKKINGV
ncbi:hypothetical protein LPJ66_008283 [Kickxella alabastrina]|uniref:Uncharacterized protein n=1 Tax=Kickxella alabastrina TaxID=61397 RepID=A0ACC1I8U2_9FUNG|nr:hypothetical protein LPJ66_008283 [Kickxella alabastrina]